MEFNRNVQPPANIVLPEFTPQGAELAFNLFKNEANSISKARQKCA